MNDPIIDVTWDEGESVMRQLVKELRAAEKANAAYIKAREADDKVQAATAEYDRLVIELDLIRNEIATARAEGQAEAEAVAATRAQREAAHEEKVSSLRGQASALEGRIAELRREAKKAESGRDATLAKIKCEASERRRALDETYAAAEAEKRAEIEALERQRQHLVALVEKAKAGIAALP